MIKVKRSSELRNISLKNKVIFLFISLFIINVSAVSASEIWRENREAMPEYDLEGKKILMVIGYDYDHHEVFEIRDIWESWGAIVHTTALEEKTEGHTISFNGIWFDSKLDSIIETDILLEEASMNDYDALYFPGGKGPEHLVEKSPEILHRLIDEAIKKQAIIGAICGGPYVFTVHDHFKGMQMTVSPSKRAEMTDYGIKYVNEKVVITDNIITGNWPFFETFAITMAHSILFPEDDLKDIFPSSGCYMTDFIREQRSPQAFREKAVDIDTLNQIISSGLSLPWVRFMHQDWHFIAISSPEKRVMIKERVLENIKENDLHPNASEAQIKNYWNHILDNPVLLLGFHRTETEDLSPSRIRLMEQNIISAGAQISLKANYLGLGTQWISAFPAIKEPLKEVLDIGEDLHLVFVMVLGHPEEYALPNVRKSIDKVFQIY